MEPENASSRRFSGVRDIDKCCTRDAHFVAGRVSQVIRTKYSLTFWETVQESLGNKIGALFHFAENRATNYRKKSYRILFIKNIEDVEA